MSETKVTAETSDFGGWRKRRGQDIYEPKEGHPYVVALADGPERVYTATRTGDAPELLDSVVVVGTDKDALLAAQGVCERHWREQEAQHACQEHHREQHPPPQAEPAETAPEPEPPLKQVDKDGSKRRQRKAEKAAAGPPLEKGPWVIRRPPGTALLAELAPKQAEAHEEIRVLQKAIEDSAQRHKELKNKKEKEIAGIEERLDELSREVRFGTTATVTCWRRREGDDWVYYGDKEATNELWRESAADGPQQRLCGKEVARAGELDELLARAMAFVAPPSELTEVEERIIVAWPWCELSWHPFVLARQLELRELLEAADPPPATGPHSEPEADPDPPPEKLYALVAGEPLLWSEHDSDRGREHRAGGFWEGYVVHRVKPKSKLLQVRHYNLALKVECTFGAFATVDKAKAAAQRDNDTRLRFPGDVASGLLVSLCGHYQLEQQKPDSAGAGLWHAKHIGSLDEVSQQLTDEPEELAEAITACQADADQRRGEG